MGHPVGAQDLVWGDGFVAWLGGWGVGVWGWRGAAAAGWGAAGALFDEDCAGFEGGYFCRERDD